MKNTIALCLVATMVFSVGQLAGAENAEAVKVAKEGAQAARNQDWDKAITLFRRATELDRKNAPNLAAVLQQRAVAYFGEQKFDMAVSDLNDALKLTPNDPILYERRAYIEMQVRDLDKALADYSEAIKLQPNESRYYQTRSYIYEVKGDIKNSMADTDNILK